MKWSNASARGTLGSEAIWGRTIRVRWAECSARSTRPICVLRHLRPSGRKISRPTTERSKLEIDKESLHDEETAIWRGLSSTEMSLTTHRSVGATLATLPPSSPVLEITAGFATNYAIDAIPHRDYPLQFI